MALVGKHLHTAPPRSAHISSCTILSTVTATSPTAQAVGGLWGRRRYDEPLLPIYGLELGHTSPIRLADYDAAAGPQDPVALFEYLDGLDEVVNRYLWGTYGEIASQTTGKCGTA